MNKRDKDIGIETDYYTDYDYELLAIFKVSDTSDLCDLYTVISKEFLEDLEIKLDDFLDKHYNNICFRFVYTHDLSDIVTGYIVYEGDEMKNEHQFGESSKFIELDI